MDNLDTQLQRALLLDNSSSSTQQRRGSDADRSSALRPHLLATSATDPKTPLAPDDDGGVRLTPPKQLLQHTCDTTVCAALKVFATTELLEIILGHIATADILNLRRTSRKWNAVIIASPSLRLHLFVNPQWSRHPSDFQLLGLKFPGLSIELGDEVELGRWIQIRMNKPAALKIFPHVRMDRRRRSRSIFEGLRGGLGSRGERSTDPWPNPKPIEATTTALKYEGLFVTQPPILGMQAFLVDCEKPPPSSSDEDEGFASEDDSACAKLHCDAGINLGFLAETAITLLPDNKPADQADDRTVVFKAIVSFAKSTRASGKRSVVRSVTRIG